MAATLEHDLNQERTAALGRGPRLRSPLSRWQLHIARLPRSGTAIDTLIYLTFFLLIGLPLGVVLVQAVLPDLFDPAAAGTRFSLAPLARVFASTRLAVSVLNSLELAGTVAVAALEFRVPPTTARNLFPFMARVSAATFNCAVFTPEKVESLARSDQLVPPSVERCHCTVGAGAPVVPTRNVAASPVFCTMSCG